MSHFFKCHHLQCTIDDDTKTFIISLSRPSKQNVFGKKTLFEIKNILEKISCQDKIDTILIRGEGEGLSDGIDGEELKRLNLSEFNEFNENLKKIVTAMFFLPQVIVVDIGNKAKGHALELSLGADIRIARVDAHIEFDFLSKGLCPGAGGISVLQRLIGHSKARFWILSSHKLSPEEIKDAHFVHQTYGDNREECVKNLLTCLHHNAPVCRVQAKRGLLEAFFETFDKANMREAEFARAAHFCEDWRTVLRDTREFTSLKEMKTILRMTEKGLVA